VHQWIIFRIYKVRNLHLVRRFACIHDNDSYEFSMAASMLCSFFCRGFICFWISTIDILK
jgi:hypothetical protein